MASKAIDKEIASTMEGLIEYARRRGADEIEVFVGEGSELGIDVRRGRIENLVRAGSRSLSFRLIRDKRTASASSSKLDSETLRRLVDHALERAVLTNPDEFAGLPEPCDASMVKEPLNLYDPEIEDLTPETGIDLAIRTEKHALSDPRITNSHGASFENRKIITHLANSHGFTGSFRESFFHLSIGLQAGGTDDRVEDSWSSSQRHFRDLESPEEVADRAVERTVRHLNPRKITTRSAPVIFEPEMTAWVMGFLFSCISGTAVYNRATFLADKLGEKIGCEGLMVLDDGRRPGLPGSAPFDSEGVPTRKTTVVKAGRLTSFLCDTYSGRKLQLESTGNASGTGVGPTNFFLAAGSIRPSDILRTLDRGLILTRVLGHGMNPVTGDFSRGAFGLWVEKGKVIHSVSEITISGNLGSLLMDIEEIGNDLEFREQISGPTIKVGGIQIAGR